MLLERQSKIPGSKIGVLRKDWPRAPKLAERVASFVAALTRIFCFLQSAQVANKMNH